MCRSVARALYCPRSARAVCYKYLKRWTGDISSTYYLKYLEDSITSWIYPAKDGNVLFLRQYLAFWGAVSITRDGRWMEVDERALWFPKSSFMTWSFLFLPILITEPWISANDCYFSFFTWCQSFTLVTSRSYESVSDRLLWLLQCCHLQLLVNL